MKTQLLLLVGTADAIKDLIVSVYFIYADCEDVLFVYNSFTTQIKFHISSYTL